MKPITLIMIVVTLALSSCTATPQQAAPVLIPAPPAGIAGGILSTDYAALEPYFDEISPFSGNLIQGVEWHVNHPEKLQPDKQYAVIYVGLGALMLGDNISVVGVADDPIALALIKTGGSMFVIDSIDKIDQYTTAIRLGAYMIEAVIIRTKITSRLANDHQWTIRIAQLSDEQWNQWLDKILSGIGGPPTNWRSMDPQDLYDNADKQAEFLKYLGQNLDDFLYARGTMDDLQDILRWQDVISGLCTEELVKEGFSVDTPTLLTDLLDDLLGNITDGQGTVIDNQPREIPLEELYRKLREVINAIHAAGSEGDDWTDNHPETIEFLDELLQVVKRLLNERGIYPD